MGKLRMVVWSQAETTPGWMPPLNSSVAIRLMDGHIIHTDAAETASMTAVGPDSAGFTRRNATALDRRPTRISSSSTAASVMSGHSPSAMANTASRSPPVSSEML